MSHAVTTKRDKRLAKKVNLIAQYYLYNLKWLSSLI